MKMDKEDVLSNDMREKTMGNMFWRFAERCGAQGVAFIVTIVLARILDPEAYGTITLIAVFIAIMQVFIDSGLGNALIQKKDADQLDFSTTFLFNMVMCVCLYIILFLSAPYIAAFYDEPKLTILTRVLGITLIISGLKNIQQAYVSRQLLFRKFFFATLGGTIVAAIVGIAMALAGYGVWALVVQQVTNIAIDTFILYITIEWRPAWAFSIERFKVLIGYGWKILVSSLLDTSYNNLRQLVIGKMYSSNDLAYYNKGGQFPNFIITNINSSIDSVLLPVMSQEQNDRERVKAMTRRAIKTSCYIIWPLMMGLAVCAESIVKLVLTDKWLPCVPYLQIFCFVYALWPMHTANLNAIKAMGRSDVFLKLEIIKKVLGILSIVISVRYGVFAIAFAMVIMAPMSSFINAFPNKRILGYSYMEQIKDIVPELCITIFMGTIVSFISLLNLHYLIILIIQVVVGSISYVFISELLKIDSYIYLKEMVGRKLISYVKGK